MIGVSDAYHRLAVSPVRPLSYKAEVSFTKARSTETDWFTLDQSELSGPDLLAEDESRPIQMWDAYDYRNVSERVIDLNISRSVQFPYNVQSAVADFTLNNYDDYLSISGAGGSSPLSQYIVPKRPCRLYLGFKGVGLAPQFVGLTQGVPSYDGFKNERATFSAMDFLSEIGDMKLNNMVMMRNARTDEVIAAILEQFGLDSRMYDLGHGLNTIPFVYFESGKDAGATLRELVQAEDGAMWLDERGVIRFESRASQVGKAPVMVFDENSIVDISPSREAGVVNTISITAEIRRVVGRQPVFTADNSLGYQNSASEDAYRISARGSATVWLNFDDPVWSAEGLVLNGAQTGSNFQVVNLSGEAVFSGVSATGTLFATSYKLELSNTNSYPVSVSALQLWGQPAKMYGDQPIEYQAQDSDSVAKYGALELTITDNKCFGSVDNARAYAARVLAEYSEYSNVLEMKVKGDPSLQMQDVVTIDYPNYAGNYVVKGSEHRLSDTQLETTLTLRKTTLTYPFILDQSILDGPDLLMYEEES